MKNRLQLIVLAILLIWLGVLTFAFMSERRHTLNQLRTITSQPVPNSNVELITLRTQVQQIIDYNDDFLSTVHWSIGYASTFLLAFLGLVGYLTNRRYEQDKESLETMLNFRILEAQTHLDSKVDELRNSLHSEHEVRIKELKDSSDATARDLRNSLTEIANSRANSVISPLKESFDDLKHDVLLLKYDNLKAEAKAFEENKSYSQSLSKQFDIAQIGVEINWEWIISGALKNIERLLEQGGTFSADKIREVNQFLNKLPADYEPFIKRIREKL